MQQTLTVLQLALLARRVREHPDQLSHVLREPIAIVGMGCRFPGGVQTPQDFWQLLRQGRDAVTTRAADRPKLGVDQVTNSSAVTIRMAGGYLDSVDQFDAEFFGLSPREAISLDPQHRLLLEVTWEALESGAQFGPAFDGSSTGVFIGISTGDYSQGELHSGNLSEIGPYALTGNTPSMAAGRLSYVLNLHGPSIVVDTACSSSLTALHLACQSLRLGECSMAIVGGVNLILSDDLNVAFREMRALSPEGKCRSFDAAANGYVRGEGCGVVVLKRLGDAIAHRDMIYAVVRGSAINQDGRSAGLTAPNGQAQAEVIQAALNAAGIAPAEIDYIEAHGTGTPLGDPIELAALDRVLAVGRSPEQQLRVGSVKTNIGHLEAAAGIAGLIKVVLAMQHAEIPPHLHFETVNPNVSTRNSRWRIPQTIEGWPRVGKPRLAGVSAFGMSGGNVHVVLEEAPKLSQSQSKCEPASQVLPLSGRSRKALAQSADRLMALLANDRQLDIGDLCHTLATGRRHFEYRAALSVTSMKHARQQLAKLVDELHLEPGDRSVHPMRRVPRVALFFHGGSAQRAAGLGFDVQSLPALQLTCHEVVESWRRRHGESAIETIVRWGGGQPLTPGEDAALRCLLEIGLARQWKSWGIQPVAALGVGLGRFSASCVAGCMNAVNALALVAEYADHWTDERQPLAESAGAVFDRPLIPLIESDTGFAVPQDQTFDLARLMKGTAQPIASSVALSTLRDLSCSAILEVGSASDWQGKFWDDLSDAYPKWLCAQALDHTLWDTLTKTLAELYELGADINWTAVDAPFDQQRVLLPTYPFQRRQHWISSRGIRVQQDSNFSNDSSEHEFVLTPQLVSQTRHVYACDLNERLRLLLDQHRIFDRPTLPATGYLAAALAVGRQIGPEPLISNLQMLSPVVPPGDGMLAFQLIANRTSDQKWDFEFRSSTDTERAPSSWIANAIATIDFATAIKNPSVAESELEAHLTTEVVSGAVVRQALRERGLAYGLIYHGLREARLTKSAGWGAIDLAVPLTLNDCVSDHPAVLDACLHALVLLIQRVHASSKACLPVSIDRAIVIPCPAQKLSVYFTLGVSGWTADASVYNEIGEPIAILQGIRVEAVDHATWQAATTTHDFRVVQRFEIGPLIPRSDERASSTWIISAVDSRWETQLVAALGHGVAAPRTRSSGELDDDGSQRASSVATHEISRNRAILVYVATRSLAERYLASTDDLVKETYKQCDGLLKRLQWLSEESRHQEIDLVVVTRGGLTVPDQIASADPVAAALAAIARVYAREHPELSVRIIDLDPAEARDQVQTLIDELMGENTEQQIAYRQGQRWVADGWRDGSPEPLQAHSPRELRKSECGGLDELTWLPCARMAPREHEIEIQVAAAGLNFLDLMEALDRLPFSRVGLGMECAGRVSRVGSAVRRFSVGQRVMAIANPAFRNYVIADERLAAAIPGRLAWEDAAGIPGAFLTSLFVLQECARLESGETVLVHAAAGGVGLAEVQLAQRIGARVIATAGSAPKQEFLRALGVDAVLSSRTLDFAKDIEKRFGAGCVDVICNSLAGEFVPTSLSLLRDGGRFVEIGKSDIWSPAEMNGVRPDVKYFQVDLNELCQNQPSQVESLLRQVAEDIARGALRPLPVSTFAASRATEALRYMSAAKHIGKIALHLDATAANVPKPIVRKEVTYLITGGGGALGMIVAQWLIELGCTHLVLIGRSPANQELQEKLNSWRQSGLVVEFRQADVTSFGQLSKLFTELRGTMPPFAGIVHAAGILDDDLIEELDPQRFSAVLQPKVDGAWNLHDLTRKDALDFFVMFSSIASLVAPAGQASYVAANSWMDAFASFRRHLGLPATSINWGPWKDRGMVTQIDARVRDTWRQFNLAELTLAQARTGFMQAIHSGAPQVGVVALTTADDSGLEKSGFLTVPARSTQSSLDQLSNDRTSLTDLKNLNPERRQMALIDHVKREVARVLGILELEAIENDVPLRDLGLDSLMAVDLVKILSSHLGRPLPASLLSKQASVQTLADYLAKQPNN